MFGPVSDARDRWLLILLRRGQLPVLAALLLVTVICWWYLFTLAQSMSAMAMAPAAAFTQMQSRDLFDLWLLFSMWVVMMVGMMLPSAAPMILLYSQVAKKAASQQRALAPATVFTLSAGMGTVQCRRDTRTMVAGTMGVDVTGDGRYQPLARRWRSRCCRCLPVLALERPLPGVLPQPCLAVIPALAAGMAWRPDHGDNSRLLLPRLLLGPDGTFVCGGRDEPAVGRRHRPC